MAALAQQRWTPSEISRFEKRTAEGASIETIAAELGRTAGSVRMRGQIDNVRKCQRRIRETNVSLRQQADVAVQWVVPPTYVRRERDIRLSIPPVTVTQVIFADPVEGYSALASKARKISVQDALEICAIYTGARGQDRYRREAGRNAGLGSGGDRMTEFCQPKFDGLGTSCGRCGNWVRGTDAPRCPPYVTRKEPDGDRLPHIKTQAQNTQAHAAYMAEIDRECEIETAKMQAAS